MNPSQSGAYTLEFRVASVGAGGTFHIEVNGVDRTGPISIPDTGGWQNWATVTKSGVNLSAGSQAWRLVVDAVGGGGNVGNFNYLRVTAQTSSAAASTPYRSTPTALPGTLQLEDFDRGGEGSAYHDLSASNDGEEYRSTGVDVESTTDAGGGYNVGYVFAGEWLNYTVNVASAGTYDIEVRVASPGAGGTFHLEVNGVNKTGAFTVPDTGDWQDWVTLRKAGITLSAGQQVFRLVMDSEGSSGAVANFNSLRVAGGTGSGGGGSTRTPAPPWPCPARCSSRLSTMAVRAWRSTTCLPRTPAARSAQPALMSNQPATAAAATTSATPSPASGWPTR